MEDVKIFISYAHEDESYLQKLKQYCLSFADKQGVKIWDDGKLKLGDKWDDGIKTHLRQADIILFLVSIDFLQSEYINDTEMKEAFIRHAQKECYIIPLFVRYVKLTDYASIKDLQGFPSDGKYLAEIEAGKIDRYYSELEDKLKNIVTQIRNDKQFKKATIVNDIKAVEVKNREQAQKKICLIVPENILGSTLKDYFKQQAEDEAEHKKWPFEIIDYQQEADLSTSIFSIHIFASDEDLQNPDLVKLFRDTNLDDRDLKRRSVILWVASTEIADKLPLEMMACTVVTGTKPVEVINRINILEAERQESIKLKKDQFAQQLNVYLLYDFSTDHKNQIRVQLKNELEKRSEIMPFFAPPAPKTGEIEEQLSNSKGVILFYGNTDANWYCSWQAKVQKLNSLKGRAVCISDPQKNDKIQEDVNTVAFMVMEDEKKLPEYLNEFINNMKHSA